MQSRVSPEDSCLHQDINKLIAAAEFSADATLNSAKFASRAVASNITSRRLLWLQHWQADMRTKWRLAAVPFKVGSLFREAPDPILVESRDKRKILPYVSRRPDRRSTFPYHRQSFWSSDPGYNPRPTKGPSTSLRTGFMTDSPSGSEPGSLSLGDPSNFHPYHRNK